MKRIGCRHTLKFQGEIRFNDGCSFVRQAPEEYSMPTWK